MSSRPLWYNLTLFTCSGVPNLILLTLISALPTNEELSSSRKLQFRRTAEEQIPDLSKQTTDLLRKLKDSARGLK